MRDTRLLFLEIKLFYMAKLINGIEFIGKQINNERSREGIFDIESYKETY